MDENVLRRIANNHRVSFRIEAMSWDYVGGVQITCIKEEEDCSKSCLKQVIPREDIDNSKDPNMLFASVMLHMINEIEKEDMHD